MRTRSIAIGARPGSVSTCAGVSCATSRSSAARSVDSQLQSCVPPTQPLAFQQVGHQIGHLLQVAQQGLAPRSRIAVLGQQFRIQARTRDRAAQLMADGQQQGALGLQHLVDAGGHRIDVAARSPSSSRRRIGMA